MTHVVSDIGERKPASSEIPPRADHIAAATQHRRHWARRNAVLGEVGRRAVAHDAGAHPVAAHARIGGREAQCRRTVRERATGNAEQSPSFAISWRRSLEFAITCR